MISLLESIIVSVQRSIQELMVELYTACLYRAYGELTHSLSFTCIMNSWF